MWEALCVFHAHNKWHFLSVAAVIYNLNALFTLVWERVKDWRMAIWSAVLKLFVFILKIQGGA